MGKNPDAVRRGRQSRRKGGEYELEVVNNLKELGLTARKIPLSGASEGFPGDIEVIAGFDGNTKYLGECKRRKNLPEWIVNALGENDFVAMRGDRGETLVMLRLPTFGELLQ